MCAGINQFIFLSVRRVTHLSKRLGGWESVDAVSFDLLGDVGGRWYDGGRQRLSTARQVL